MIVCRKDGCEIPATQMYPKLKQSTKDKDKWGRGTVSVQN